jgi:transmembrane sensor
MAGKNDTTSPRLDAEDPLVQDALAWLVHLHSGEETAADWEAFQDWRAADEDHRKAAKAAEKLWESLGPVLRKKPRRAPPALMVLLAAGVVAAIVAVFASGMFGPIEAYFADYRSGVGQVRSVTLADGSRIDLDTGTSFDAEKDGRTIKLYAGQVYVSVKPHPDRPFTVIAGDTRITALGTAFAVRRDRDAGSVVVTEHAVQVATPSTGSGQTATAQVAADHSVLFSRAAGIAKPRRVDAKRLTSWRTGELVFNGLPLGEVIAEVERYRHGKILILDRATARMPVTGNVDLSDTDSFLTSLELALSLRIIRLPGLVLIKAM